MKPKHFVLINNQNGSVLLITVVVLIAVTLLGIFAMNTSTIEVQIAGNDKFHKQAFYNAEGGLRAIYPLIDDIRNGIDPTTFAGTYGGFSFAGNPVDFWDELSLSWDESSLSNANNDTSGTDAAPDVIVTICNNAAVDIDKLPPDMTGETIINRAGYEGLGKGVAANYVAPYRIFSTVTGGSGVNSQTAAILESIR